MTHTQNGVTLYVITETYENNAGRHSSTVQKHTSLQEAVAALPAAVAERFGCATPQEWERIYGRRLDDHFTSPQRDRWVMADESEKLELRVKARPRNTARHESRA